ncbi:MAG: mechanosensitive ion channel family protein [Flavobacteriales bacterium]|nr:mechanosensitive ion channel family protein [Flavobacteriales bacterium]
MSVPMGFEDLPVLASVGEEIPTLLEKLGFNLLLLGKIVLIVLGAFILERVIRYLLRRNLKRQRVVGREDMTRYRFLRNGTRFIVGLLAFASIVYSIPSIKHVAVTLFAGAGILVAILGLATQSAFSNIISGVFIVGFKPFRVGDMLEVAGHRGTVEDITLRHTVILSFENRRVIIPNALISDQILVNSTIVDESTCQFVEFGIDYTSDLDKAMRIMRDEAGRHPQCLDKRTQEEKDRGQDKVMVRLVQVADSALILRAWVWAKDPMTAREMHFELNRSIKLRFDREGIEIPYPHRTLVYKGTPEADEKGQEKV